MPNPAPGFAKHPGYVVDIDTDAAHVRVYAGDTLIADTRNPLKVSETNLQPVWYVPWADVVHDALTRTQTSTYCPFKGHASYWRVETDAGAIDDAVWGYEAPFDECAPLQNHVAFYPNKVTIDVQQAG